MGRLSGSGASVASPWCVERTKTTMLAATEKGSTSFAYVLSVLASALGFLAVGFSAKHLDPMELAVYGYGSIGLPLLSVLNAPLILRRKWRAAASCRDHSQRRTQ
jgi:hypothetical protein